MVARRLEEELTQEENDFATAMASMAETIKALDVQEEMARIRADVSEQALSCHISSTLVVVRSPLKLGG